MTDSELKVVYILGSGRSGSTLLSRVLAQADVVVAPGEVGLMWQRGLLQNDLCDCGTPFSDCMFWQEVLRGALAPPKLGDARAIDRLHWRLTSLQAVPDLLMGSNSRAAADLERYRELLAGVYRCISQLSGCRVIVDASKRPTNALLLGGIPSMRLYCLHLVRDGRGVAFSYSRLPRRRRSLGYSSLHWLAVNALSELVARRCAGRLQVRYEDFCQDPQKQLSRIASFTGENVQSVYFSSAYHLEVSRAHGLGGKENAVRFHQGDLRIQVNDRWRAEMQARERDLVTGLTWPLLLRYGYLAGRGPRV